MSVDITQSSSRVQRKRDTGQSVRILYAKTFTSTNTNFTLAAYRYSTSGYRTFNDHINDLSDTNGMQYGRSRSRIDFMTSQDLGGSERKFGSIYLNVSQQTYWGQSGSSRSVSLGYGNSWKSLSYNLSLSQSKDSRSGSGGNNTQAILTMSIPLGNKLRSPRAYTNVSNDSN
ncbi:fimbrial biogenesis outer membrane usher protein, partial [Pseudomonas sp. MWU12-2534b]